MKKILVLLIVLVVASAFYIYVIMKDGELEKDRKAFLVKDEAAQTSQGIASSSTNADVLARNFGAPIISGNAITKGEIEKISYLGTEGLRLYIESDNMLVYQLRPLSFAALLEREGLTYTATDFSLLGYKTSMAEKDGLGYVFFNNESAAYLVVFQNDNEGLSRLSNLRLVRP